MIASWFSKIRAPFYDNGRFHPLLFLTFLFINLVVFANAILHDPHIGYDSGGHLIYITTISEGRFPTFEETNEFFSPPLPYLLPALVMRLTSSPINQIAKFAQLFNGLLSIGATLFLLRICQLIAPNAPSVKQISLLFLGMLPVYYKTFAFIRGEPFVVLFTLITVYYALQIFGKLDVTPQNTVALGISLGLLGLSRQWGFLVFPAIGLLAGIMVLKDRQRRRPFIISFSLSILLAFIICGWFYLSLSTRYGSATTFNRIPYEQFALSNQVEGFFTNYKSDFLFTEPVRDNFNNQVWPIFYAELWGDYWGYFSVYGRDLRTGKWLTGYGLSSALLNEKDAEEWLETNRYSFAPYLGRVNTLGVLPITLGIIALLYGGIIGSWQIWRKTQPDIEATALALFFFLTLSSLAGYFYFLVMYHTPYGDTIKATYMLHIFPTIGCATAVFLRKFPPLIPISTIVGSLILLHNLSAFFTRFNQFHG